MSEIREAIQVEFECGHTMVYDKHSDQGEPVIGESGVCRRCNQDAPTFVPVERMVVTLRQCWIETTIKVHFEKPRGPGDEQAGA